MKDLREYNRIKQKEQWERDKLNGIIKVSTKIHESWLDEFKRMVKEMKEPKR